MWESLVAAIRGTLLWLINLAVAMFGTAVIETPVSRLFRPHAIGDVLVRTYLLSTLVALSLGFFIYRQWKPGAAKWVELVGFAGSPSERS
jgi:hypothetical protein